MPRSLILHIGTMKTGSTTIQALLAHNRAAMRERGICYARTGKLTNHLLLAFAFCSKAGLPQGANAPLWGGRDPEVAMEETCSRFRSEMAELPPEISRVIVSSEMLSQYVVDREDVARLRELVAPFFDDIEILVYLRRQDCHVASNYSQSLRRGILDRPSLVAWKERKEGLTYDYEQLLQPWAEVFGEAAIKPRVFERDTDKSWDVVADFIAATGTGPLPPPSRKVRQNPSMNAAGQRALREIGWILKGEDKGQLFARTKLWRRLVGEVTGALPGRGWQPTQAEARDFVARYEASNERVRQRWFPDRPRLFSDDYAHLPEKRPTPEPDEDLRAVTTVLVHVVRQALDREDKQAKRVRRGLDVKRALRQNKDDPNARLELARLSLEAGEFHAARRHVDRVLRKAPDNEAAHELLREIEAQSEDPASDEAEMLAAEA